MLSPRAIWISGFIFCFLDLQGYLFPSGLICRKPGKPQGQCAALKRGWQNKAVAMSGASVWQQKTTALSGVDWKHLVFFNFLCDTDRSVLLV